MGTETKRRIVAVTGAASGIGRAVALRLAAAGATLALLDQDRDGVRRTASEATEAGSPQALALAADVANEASVAAALEQIAVLGELDGLVSAAGILQTGGLADTTAETWQRHLDVNATGVFHVLQQAAPRLRDGGSVVVVSSNSARVPRTGMLAYAASKAAASALTRCAGLELAARGIRCNVVEPGSTDTPMLRTLWPDAAQTMAKSIEGDPASYRVGIPLGRVAQPDDAAALVCFLLSDDARHLTLQQIYVDGGASL
ncbi:MAG: SDR family oxidoreductase [Leucobacter sp.]